MEALKVKIYTKSYEMNQRDLLLCLIISPWQLQISADHSRKEENTKSYNYGLVRKGICS